MPITVDAALPANASAALDDCFLARVAVAAERWAEAVAFQVPGSDGPVSTTYSQLRAEVAATAAALADGGIAVGDRVALLIENHPRWCVCFLAVLHRRAVAVPLDINYTDREIVALLDDCQARAIFATPGYVERLRRLQPQLPRLERVIPVPLEGRAAPSGVPSGAPWDPAWGRRDELVCLLYTSGTTGDPKGVMLTNGNILAELDGLTARVAVDSRDTILSLLPLTHILALLTNVLFPLTVGAKTVFLGQLTSAAILDALRRERITVFGGVPQLFYLIHGRVHDEVRRRGRGARTVFRLLTRLNGALRTRLRRNGGRALFAAVHRSLGGHLKLLYSGGSFLDPDVIRDFHCWGFDLVQAYGLTETAGVVCVTPVHDNRMGTVGPPLPAVEVRIDGSLAADGSGEVVIRGPTVMAGYYGKPQQTAAVIRDGWLRTGDLGRLDRDGHLTLIGRCKDVIVLANGKNVYPEELERHYGAVPFVKEICVLGLPRTSGFAGEEELHAVIVPDFDALRAAGIASVAVQIRFGFENASTELAPYKRVLSYELRSEPLPRTRTRKIQRHLLTGELHGRAPAAAPADLSAAERAVLESPEGRVVTEAVRQSGRGRPGGDPACRASDHLELDLGFDSLARIELLTAVQQRLGVRLEPGAMGGLATIGEAILALRSAASAPADGRAGSWREILSEAARDEALQAPFRTTAAGALTNLFVAKGVGRALRLLFRVRVSGREHLPRTGPYLLCPNHQSVLDAFLIAATLPSHCARNLFTLGDSGFFGRGLGARFARMQRVIAVDADGGLLDAMRLAAAGLGAGKVLCLFPEGERTVDGTLRPFRKGAAMLARELAAPIVPVAIAGAFQAWSRTSKRIRLHKVLIRFGPAIDVRPYAAMDDPEAAYALLTAHLRDSVARLLAEIDPAAVPRREDVPPPHAAPARVTTPTDRPGG